MTNKKDKVVGTLRAAAEKRDNAGIVAAVAACFRAGLDRRKISRTIRRAFGMKLTRPEATQYIKLGRKIKEPVKVGTATYPSPLKAVKAGRRLSTIVQALRRAA